MSEEVIDDGVATGESDSNHEQVEPQRKKKRYPSRVRIGKRSEQ